MHGHVWLGVAEFEYQCEGGDGVLYIYTGGADFSFGGRSHDVGRDFRHGVNGSIETRASSGKLFRIRRTVAEKIMDTGAASGAGCGKV